MNYIVSPYETLNLNTTEVRGSQNPQARKDRTLSETPFHFVYGRILFLFFAVNPLLFNSFITRQVWNAMFPEKILINV